MTARRVVLGALAAPFASATAGVPDRDDPRLSRLESALERQLSRGRSALPLPWRESILKPDMARLVWRPRSLSLRPGGDTFRVAIDPPTHWYYVAQASGAGAARRLYGPIDEASRGVFVNALDAAAAPAKGAKR